MGTVPMPSAAEVTTGGDAPRRRSVRTALGVGRAGGAALGRLRREARTLATPVRMRGVVMETAWMTAHAVLYPWGVLREKQRDTERYHLEGLSPRQRGLLERDVQAAGTPILLVHGMVDNRAIFQVLSRRLRAHGFSNVVTLNYSPITNDIRAAARGLAAEVDALATRTGHERVHVVGHSLGGLLARYYVQCLGGDARVHTLVTLGSPHAGTRTANLLPARLCRQLRPGSDLFAELAEPAPGCRTRFVSYWSDVDQMIIPHESAQLSHPDLDTSSVLVSGVGHMSLPIHAPVVRRVSAMLSTLDADRAAT